MEETLTAVAAFILLAFCYLVGVVGAFYLLLLGLRALFEAVVLGVLLVSQ